MLAVGSILLETFHSLPAQVWREAPQPLICRPILQMAANAHQTTLRLFSSTGSPLPHLVKRFQWSLKMAMSGQPFTSSCQMTARQTLHQSLWRSWMTNLHLPLVSCLTCRHQNLQNTLYQWMKMRFFMQLSPFQLDWLEDLLGYVLNIFAICWCVVRLVPTFSAPWQASQFLYYRVAVIDCCYEYQNLRSTCSSFWLTFKLSTTSRKSSFGISTWLCWSSPVIAGRQSSL